MPPKQLVFCRSCNIDHPRPVGRNCKREKPSSNVTNTISVQAPTVSQNLNASAASAVAYQAPSVSQNANAITVQAPVPAQSFTPDIANTILAKLTHVTDKLDSIDQRVASNEKALAAQAQLSQQNANSIVSSASVAAAPAQNESVPTQQALVPTAEYLKANPHIQAQVDSRVQELHSLNNQLPAGNIRSQRVGGNSDVIVKKCVA